ncbi:uncharacterized protein THITE_117019 [Thermothielavioides terrestris NRRL 8126]|uniref:Uncharacterized protein n=1 Tax=Thermothielavioides terrestris (strain ATCC 38088 / NRRL 8126) TaxID=578455 RepID=G2RG15_THETT|nr:uncharacterized protein THITE_117019 [Thermothielavioides terrestris NRRL 8126]AEO71769.1 hypothetical protein THITE_117019 [Thermothielavioides terrestris NRRL 8126]
MGVHRSAVCTRLAPLRSNQTRVDECNVKSHFGEREPHLACSCYLFVSLVYFGLLFFRWQWRRRLPSPGAGSAENSRDMDNWRSRRRVASPTPFVRSRQSMPRARDRGAAGLRADSQISKDSSTRGPCSAWINRQREVEAAQWGSAARGRAGKALARMSLTITPSRQPFQKEPMHETLVSMDHGTLPSADCRSELKHWPTGGRGSAPGSDFPALHMSVVCKGRTLGERTTEIFSETSRQAMITRLNFVVRDRQRCGGGPRGASRVATPRWSEGLPHELATNDKGHRSSPTVGGRRVLDSVLLHMLLMLKSPTARARTASPEQVKSASKSLLADEPRLGSRRRYRFDIMQCNPPGLLAAVDGAHQMKHQASEGAGARPRGPEPTDTNEWFDWTRLTERNKITE